MTETTEVVKINKWDGAAAKNAIDDAIREVLTGDLKCKESFALMDGRLFLCALAVGVALYALLWDYLYPFPQSKLVLIICVTSYFVLMGILTLYTTFKEKGIFVIAKEKVGNGARVWEASSYVKKHDDKYNLVVAMRDPAGKTREASITKSFANFIDTNGTVVQTLVINDVTKLYNSLSSEKKDKLVLIICVTSYFVLMGILTLYTTFKEKGIFVIAKEKVGNGARVWEASSYVKKHDDKYNLVVAMRDPAGKTREASITKSFANFIDTNGTVVQTLVINDVTKLYNSLSSEKKDK